MGSSRDREGPALNVDDELDYQVFLFERPPLLVPGSWYLDYQVPARQWIDQWFDQIGSTDVHEYTDGLKDITYESNHSIEWFVLENSQ